MRIAVIHDGSDDGILDWVFEGIGDPDVELVDVDYRLDPDAAGLRLAPGDAVLRVEDDRVARLVEERLLGPGIATLMPAVAPHTVDLPSLWRARGLPVRVERPVRELERRRTPAEVERMGGFPLGVRIVGQAGHAELIRVDSLEALHSALDLLREIEAAALLGTWEEAPILWRVLVVEGAAASAAKRVADTLDWNGPGGAVQAVPAREDVVAVAAAALACLDAPAGTVDLLERRDTTFALLHACAPPGLEEVAAWAGPDAVGRVLGTLVERARRDGAPPISEA